MTNKLVPMSIVRTRFEDIGMSMSNTVPF